MAEAAAAVMFVVAAATAAAAAVVAATVAAAAAAVASRQRWLSSAPLPLPHVQERELLDRHGVRVLETPIARAIGDAAGDLAGLVLRDGCVVPLK